MQLQYIQGRATKPKSQGTLRWSGLQADQVYETRPYILGYSDIKWKRLYWKKPIFLGLPTDYHNQFMNGPFA